MIQQPKANRRAFVLVWLFLLTFSSVGLAGGGPENVLLVVNAADPDSLTIANHFADWRKVPAVCMYFVDWPNAPEEIDIDTFRNRLLVPILKEIKQRRLQNQIDYIVYSSGFPYAVEFSADLAGQNSKYAKGSLTGMTYLYQMVLEKNAQYRGPVNAYARNLLPNADGNSHGFRARYGLGTLGQRLGAKEQGSQYFLSMMLGYTRNEFTNTVPEVLSYLKTGVEADGTKPKGTIYYVKHNKLRSTTRHAQFNDAVAKLKELGVNAEEIEGLPDPKNCLPLKKPDVQGAMVGMYKIAWGATGSRISPGAICEHFTSYGGVLDGSFVDKQTLLCASLRAGAVASSGTVTEPYATSAKFPHARMHLHYARGCSVAESFYQSVSAPYQLLIVGDPLCQPWGVAPKVKIVGLDVSQAIAGDMEFAVEAKSPSGAPIRNYDIFVDGKLVARVLPDKPIVLDTSAFTNGYHELRVVAIEDTPIETQGRTITGFVSMNRSEEADSSSEVTSLTGVTCELSPTNGKLRAGQSAQVKLRSRGAHEIRLYRGQTLLGTIPGAGGKLTVGASSLGAGSSLLTPIAIPKPGAGKAVNGFPIKVQVEMGGRSGV